MGEEIAEKVLNGMAEKLQVAPSEKADLDLKLAELKKTFLTSQATVYCEDCGLIFYSGFAAPVATEKEFVDWKMLSFRHVWDQGHKVKVYLPYFSALNQMLLKKNKALARIMQNIRKNALGFDDSEQVCYFLEVEKFRERLQRNGSHRACLSNDQNWDANSRCVCSVCHKSYYDPKNACLCHAEQKPWLPMSEVNSIQVRQIRRLR
jgi:hypothetical protein